MDSKHRHTFFTFVGDSGGTAGYARVSQISSDTSKAARVASKYLNESLLLNQLTERVYEILEEDMRSQLERVSNYSRQRWF